MNENFILKKLTNFDLKGEIDTTFGFWNFTMFQKLEKSIVYAFHFAQISLLVSNHWSEHAYSSL